MRSTADNQAFFTPLESLRGLAALTVVLFHVRWMNPITTLRFFQNGALMVDLFFVLSGFVMFHSYGQRLPTLAACGRFMWLRLGRLYPLHLAMLLVFMGLELVKYVLVKHFGSMAGPPAFAVNNGKTFVENVFLLQSVGLLKSLTFNFPSWSISAEFYTYVLFAGVTLLAGTGRRFTLAAVATVILSLALLLKVNHLPLGQVAQHWGLVRCMAGFFLGTLTYQIYAKVAAAPTSRVPWGGLSVAASIATLLFLSLLDMHGRRAFALPPLSALLILSIVLSPSSIVSRALSLRPFVWLGTVSYSIYMVHAAVLWVVLEVLFVGFKDPRRQFNGREFVDMPLTFGLVALLAYVGLILVISHFTYRGIEVRFRLMAKQLATRWWGRGPASAPTEAAAVSMAGPT